jgi:hypothetical protein
MGAACIVLEPICCQKQPGAPIAVPATASAPSFCICTAQVLDKPVVSHLLLRLLHLPLRLPLHR